MTGWKKKLAAHLIDMRETIVEKLWSYVVGDGLGQLIMSPWGSSLLGGACVMHGLGLGEISDWTRV